MQMATQQEVQGTKEVRAARARQVEEAALFSTVT